MECGKASEESPVVEKNPEKVNVAVSWEWAGKKRECSSRWGGGVQHTHSSFKMKHAVNAKFTLNFEELARK